MSTRLGQVINAGKPVASGPPRTPLGLQLANGRRGEDVDIPGIGPARIEILGARDSQAIESEVYRAMTNHGIDHTLVTADRFELERAYRTLARAVRDPADQSKAFGTADEWGEIDNDVIVAAWQAYGDVRERLDPMATPLTDNDRLSIEVAVKKKDARLLRTFGAVKLSAWLASTDGLPSISQTPNSASSESPLAP